LATLSRDPDNSVGKRLNYSKIINLFLRKLPLQGCQSFRRLATLGREPDKAMERLTTIQK
jgi:hypothetical protein